MLRIAVIGAGVVGASVAFRLAHSGGARVWVIDKSGPGSGTTSASFAWANANEKTPYDYFELNRAGLEEHYRLRDELPEGAPWLHPEGNIEWADEASLEGLVSRVERLRSWGYAAEWWTSSRANEVLEPHVAFPDTPVAFFPEEAWVEAPRLANDLVEAARRNGAETRFGAVVEEITPRDGRAAALRFQGGERLPVDAVVNAAGPEADEVAALLGRTLPLEPRKGLLVRLAVAERTPIGRLVHSPDANLRPDGPGRVIVHHGSVDQELQSGVTGTDTLSHKLLERARRVVPALEGAKVEGVRIGVRPIPEDERPCVRAVLGFPGYYEAVTDSGVTLGPILGRLLTNEILTGKVDSMLVPFRPDRFALPQLIRREKKQ